MTFVEQNNLAYVHDRILSQKLFGIESSFVEDNPSLVRPYTSAADIDFSFEIKLFTNDKAGKAGRATWYIADRSVIQNGKDFIDEWQVVVSSANAGGQKRDNQIEIIDNHSAFGRSRVALGSFKTQEKAVNFFNYSRTALIRFMYLMTDESLTSLGKKVPDIMDYSSANELIDFSKDLNKQLYKLVGLTEEEISYVESVIRFKDEGSVYKKMLNSSYADIVKYLLKKYGAAKHDYFKDTACTTKNPQVSRTAEGLYCHHIDEDKAIMLSNDQYAAANPFDYQKASRLVYCNILEHLLLHVKIAAEHSEETVEGEILGIGGAVNFICKELNDIYAGKEFADEWRRKIASVVKSNFEDYIMVLRYLWNLVEKNPMFKVCITRETLCKGYDGNVVPAVLAALVRDEDQ